MTVSGKRDESRMGCPLRDFFCAVLVGSGFGSCVMLEEGIT